MSDPHVGKPLIPIVCPATIARWRPTHSSGRSPDHIPGTTACEPTVAGAEDRRGALRQRVHHRVLVEQRVVVRERRTDAPQVVLVAPVGLDPVDPERDERADAPLELGHDRRVAEIEDLRGRAPRAACPGSRAAQVARGETQSMKRTPRRVHLLDQPRRVRESATCRR